MTYTDSDEEMIILPDILYGNWSDNENKLRKIYEEYEFISAEKKNEKMNQLYLSQVCRLVCSQIFFLEDKWKGMVLSEKLWYHRHCFSTYFVFFLMFLLKIIMYPLDVFISTFFFGKYCSWTLFNRTCYEGTCPFVCCFIPNFIQMIIQNFEHIIIWFGMLLCCHKPQSKNSICCIGYVFPNPYFLTLEFPENFSEKQNFSFVNSPLPVNLK